MHGNADDGIELNASDYFIHFANNAFIGNGAYGIDFSTMVIGDIGYFGYNLSGANTTNDYYFGGAAGTDFANFGNGNNVDSSQTADQLLDTITDGSEDFTPESSSDLVDAEDETAHSKRFCICSFPHLLSGFHVNNRSWQDGPGIF
jgi:hypothetical protein